MRSGKLRHKAEIFVPDNQKRPDGSVHSGMQSLGIYPCDVRTHARDERDKVAGVTSYVKYKVIMRYSSVLNDIPPDAELVINNSQKLHVISSMNKHHRDKVLEVLCEERR